MSDSSADSSSDSEQEVSVQTDLPIIIPRKVVKPTRKYTVSAKVIERNIKNNETIKHRRLTEKQKLAQYDAMKERADKMQSIDELITGKMSGLEEKIAELVTRSQRDQKEREIARALPPLPPLEIIHEEPEPQGYHSDSQRRFSDRFKKKPCTSPKNWTRF